MNAEKTAAALDAATKRRAAALEALEDAYAIELAAEAFAAFASNDKEAAAADRRLTVAREMRNRAVAQHSNAVRMHIRAAVDAYAFT